MNHISLRQPRLEDGPALHVLIAECPPLDLNSAYAYHLIGAHFAETSVVAEADNQLLGAITAYLPPQEADCLFVWQVAVHERGRGQGLAARMLDHLVERHEELHGRKLRCLKTTIGPSNEASHRLFARLAENRQARIQCSPFIAAEACGAGHEAEELVTIDFP